MALTGPRLLRVLLVLFAAFAAITLSCGVAKGVPPQHPTDAPVTSVSSEGLCVDCPDGDDDGHCNAPAQTDLRPTTPRPEPCATPGPARAWVPVSEARPSSADGASQHGPRAPDLHLLQLLRV